MKDFLKVIKNTIEWLIASGIVVVVLPFLLIYICIKAFVGKKTFKEQLLIVADDLQNYLDRLKKTQEDKKWD